MSKSKKKKVFFEKKLQISIQPVQNQTGTEKFDYGVVLVHKFLNSGLQVQPVLVPILDQCTLLWMITYGLIKSFYMSSTINVLCLNI